MNTSENRRPRRERSATRRVQVGLERDNRGGISGVWWPRTTDYTAEIHDLTYHCGLALGRTIEHITFAWNPSSTRRRHRLEHGDLKLTGPAPGQPREEMWLHPETGIHVRLLVVPPPPLTSPWAPRHRTPEQ
ncbi:DUF5994 family protein [Tsukamurella sp. 1534]|uniref:DUF5994 family protein n=1 Tax=Tsukamurella sp. 1534 TaxID=1151061 RepID=UPI003527BA40